MPKESHNITEANQQNHARQLYDESITKVSDEVDSLETIREILFGEQSREAEKRRHETSHSLQLNIAELKQETNNQFEFLSAEINKLYQLISDESTNRLSDKKDGNQLVDQLQTSLEQTKIRQETEHNQLQQQVRNESNKLEQQVAKRHEELSDKLEKASLELKSDKTDRSDLAKLLQGMAEQLLETSKR